MASSSFSTVYCLQTKNEQLAYRYLQSDPSLPTLLLIHGNMTSSFIWVSLVPFLQRRYNILCPDLRGLGQSSYNTPIESLDDYSPDLILLLDHLKIPTVSVIGLSMGGSLALKFGAAHSERVNAIVLIGGVGIRGYYFPRKDYQGKLIEEKIKDKEDLEKDPGVATYLTVLMTKNVEFLQILIDKFMFNVGRKVSDEVFKKIIDEALLQKNYLDSIWALNVFNIADTFNGISKGTNEIERIKCPSLIIHGEKDKVIPLKEGVNTFHSLKSEVKKIEIMENSGHLPHMDDPEKVANIIMKFFEGIKV